MLIIVLKIFLTLWAGVWFAGLFIHLKNTDVEDWIGDFIVWIFLAIGFHVALAVPFLVFSFIWFGF
jgi:hypothetical protein